MTMREVAWFIGEVSRPLAIMSTSFSASAASIIVACKVDNGDDGWWVVAAIFAGVGSLYLGKAVEMWKGRNADAKVEIAKVEAGASEEKK